LRGRHAYRTGRCGARISRGRSAEAIFEAYPSLGSLAKVYGTITFILEHPAEVEAYLQDQDRIFEEIKAQYPMSQDLIDRFERAKKSGRLAGTRRDNVECIELPRPLYASKRPRKMAADQPCYVAAIESALGQTTAAGLCRCVIAHGNSRGVYR